MDTQRPARVVGSDYNLIIGCNFVGNGVSAIPGPLGSHTVITDVTGYGGGSEQQTASYIFFTENSTYYAQENSNGQTLRAR